MCSEKDKYFIQAPPRRTPIRKNWIQRPGLDRNGAGKPATGSDCQHIRQSDQRYRLISMAAWAQSAMFDHRSLPLHSSVSRSILAHFLNLERKPLNHRRLVRIFTWCIWLFYKKWKRQSQLITPRTTPFRRNEGPVGPQGFRLINPLNWLLQWLAFPSALLSSCITLHVQSPSFIDIVCHIQFSVDNFRWNLEYNYSSDRHHDVVFRNSHHSYWNMSLQFGAHSLLSSHFKTEQPSAVKEDRRR